MTLHSQKGIALMMVLWLIVFLSIMATGFISSVRWVSGSVRNFKEETRTYYAALSAYEEAINYILSDKDPAADFLDADNNFWVDMETPTVTGRRVTEEGEVEIRISDENAKININFMNQQRLQKLLEYAGIKQDEMTTISDSILDWKDQDSEHHLSGAEDDYYESLDPPYKAKNGLFDTPEELVLVKGMKPEYLFGSEEHRAMLPIITTVGRNVININTASRDVMEMLGLTDIEIEAVLKQRTKDFGGFRFIPAQFANRGFNAVVTQNFRIEVIVKAPNSPIATHVTGIVSRLQDEGGPKLKTIYWRERAETVRA